MMLLDIKTPFHAPVYFAERCSSTMNLARDLLPENPAFGTVIVTDRQDAGRARGTQRYWYADAGESLLFTIILQYRNWGLIPKGLTLRSGLAVAEAIAKAAPPLAQYIRVKWPNDVMIDRKKVCGILAENSGNSVFAGIGININQKDFPGELRDKAISIHQALQELAGSRESPPAPRRNTVLELVLDGLHTYLAPDMDTRWKALFEESMYGIGTYISFVQGQADSGDLVEGILEGIGREGELLIKTSAGTRTFVTGELQHQYG